MVIKSGKLIHIRIKHVHVEFHQGNQIFKPIIIPKHIFYGALFGTYEQLWTDHNKIW